MSITYQQHEAHARAVRQDHDGRTSRGLSLEIARLAFDNPIFRDDPAELLSDLKQCAAACIGAGCEPRVRPLPGQSAGVARLAAAAHADQVEGTPARKQAQGTCFFPRPLGKSWLVSVEFLTGARAGEILDFRWYKRADALLCKRNFKSPPGLKLSRVTIRECLGYSTWDGWVDVLFGQEASA